MLRFDFTILFNCGKWDISAIANAETGQEPNINSGQAQPVGFTFYIKFEMAFRFNESVDVAVCRCHIPIRKLIEIDHK